MVLRQLMKVSVRTTVFAFALVGPSCRAGGCVKPLF